MSPCLDSDEPNPPAPGEGPVISVSASLHEGTVEAVFARVGKHGFSSYVEEALLRQIRRDKLRDIVEAHTNQYGDFTAKELADARAALYGTDEDQHCRAT